MGGGDWSGGIEIRGGDNGGGVGDRNGGGGDKGGEGGYRNGGRRR